MKLKTLIFLQKNHEKNKKNKKKINQIGKTYTW